MTALWDHDWQAEQYESHEATAATQVKITKVLPAAPAELKRYGLLALYMVTADTCESILRVHSNDTLSGSIHGVIGITQINFICRTPSDLPQ
jgi:hypothetical protein